MPHVLRRPPYFTSECPICAGGPLCAPPSLFRVVLRPPAIRRSRYWLWPPVGHEGLGTSWSVALPLACRSPPWRRRWSFVYDVSMCFCLNIDGHLSIRETMPDDAQAIFELIDADRERLGRWLAWIGMVQSADDERKSIEEYRLKWARMEEFMGAVLVDGDIVGSIGLAACNRSAKWAEIGYWISQPYEGRGIVTRCVRAMEALCFEQLGCGRVQITNDANNHRSRAVPERLGYTFEGVLRRHLVTDREGHIADRSVYSILKDEWIERERKVR